MAVLRLAIVTAVAFAASPALADRTPDEIALLAADAGQRQAVATMDLKAISRLSHPDLHVNAPTNMILTRDDLVRMVGSGEIRNEIFERIPEMVTVTGNVGVVMGSETVVAGKDSKQAQMFGTNSLKRRYTNVYLKVRGAWLHLARHANIVK